MRTRWAHLAVAFCLLGAAAARGDGEPVPITQFVRITLKDGKLVSEVMGAAPQPQPGAAAAPLTRETVKIVGVEGDVNVIHRATGISLSSSNPPVSRTISITPAVIGMSETNNAAGALSRVTLQQRNTAGAANAVILNVTNSGAGGGAANNIQFSEATFGDMWSKHPEEMKKYVEPMFRAWGMPNMFMVTLDDARGLLAELKRLEEAKDDTQTKQKVTSLLTQLSADTWKEREAARVELLAMGKVAVPYLRGVAVDDLPVEAAGAVKAALDAQEDRRLSDPTFFLQCVGLDDAAVAAEGARRYEKMTGKKLDIDLSEPATEREAAVEKILLGGA